jgi:hypothetical protein
VLRSSTLTTTCSSSSCSSNNSGSNSQWLPANVDCSCCWCYRLLLLLSCLECPL